MTLEENGRYVYSDGSAECTVRNPDGGEVSVRTPSASIEINNHQMFGSFNATKAGEYTVTCNSLLNTPVYLGEGVTAGGILNSAAGIVLAVLGLVIGAVPMRPSEASSGSSCAGPTTVARRPPRALGSSARRRPARRIRRHPRRTAPSGAGWSTLSHRPPPSTRPTATGSVRAVSRSTELN